MRVRSMTGGLMVKKWKIALLVIEAVVLVVQVNYF
jgi:hypothetical protein